MINLYDFNYALMGGFLIVNIVAFLLNVRYSVHHHISLDSLPSGTIEKELLHWSLYGSLILPVLQSMFSGVGAFAYFTYSGILVLFAILAIIIGTHKKFFDNWLIKIFSNDSSKNSEKSHK